MRDDDKIRNSDDVDKIVCAKVPDPDKQPRLYNTVKSSMIHGPCGKFNGKSPCMESGVCSKGYPREYCNQSVINVEGYPSYRRRNNQRFIDIHRRDGSLKYRVNNQWIVPYNPYLLQKYNCHINVEVCSTIKSVKYLYKYIYKGHDCANIEISHKGDRAMNWDEVQMFLDSRYISAPEAIWRLFEFKMHDQSHSIITLAVHLPEGQSVYFIAGEEETAVERSARRNTTLTAYFQLNAKDEKARQYLYTEVPEHYVFSHGIWKERVRGAEKIISRMYTVSPMDIERYHLRLLLLHVRGARSFDELKLVEGISCDSFKEAARRRHLLKDDLEWERCLVEASTYQMPRQLRQLMAFICILCNPTNAQQLWMAHKCYMIEDFHRLHSDFESENLALADIENTLMTYGKRCVDFGLPQPIMRGKVYFLLDESTRVTDVTDIKKKINTLNVDQKNVFEAVTKAVEHKSYQQYIFLDGPGGSGKTYLYSTLISYLRSIEKAVIAIAWTGIAATLLEGGRTVHSMFKLPVPLLQSSSCDLRLFSPQALQIKEADIIIWDEVTMASCYALDAIDRFLRDLMDSQVPFGGKVVVLSGDFRQCLPVVKHGSKTEILEQ